MLVPLLNIVLHSFSLEAKSSEASLKRESSLTKSFNSAWENTGAINSGRTSRRKIRLFSELSSRLQQRQWGKSNPMGTQISANHLCLLSNDEADLHSYCKGCEKPSCDHDYQLNHKIGLFYRNYLPLILNYKILCKRNKNMWRVFAAGSILTLLWVKDWKSIHDIEVCIFMHVKFHPPRICRSGSLEITYTYTLSFTHIHTHTHIAVC